MCTVSFGLLRTNGNSHKHVIPILLHKIDLIKRYTQALANKLSISSVLIGGALHTLVQRIPVGHIHTLDIETYRSSYERRWRGDWQTVLLQQIGGHRTVNTTWYGTRDCSNVPKHGEGWAGTTFFLNHPKHAKDHEEKQNNWARCLPKNMNFSRTTATLNTSPTLFKDGGDTLASAPTVFLNELGVFDMDGECTSVCLWIILYARQHEMAQSHNNGLLIYL